VTDVIVLSLQAIRSHLSRDTQLTIVVGNDTNLDTVKKRLETDDPSLQAITIKVIPQLDYLESQSNPPSTEELLRLLNQRYGGKDRLWWVHNYQLGKNPIFTDSLISAAEQGQPLLFHIHDFPECARYENLSVLKSRIKRNMYPTGKNVRYSLINPRDQHLLIESGLPEESVFLLENPVPLKPVKTADSSRIKKAMYQSWKKDFPFFQKDAPLLLYPVRSIRRKNILEAGLLIRLMNQPVNLVVTLPGVSESEKEYSRQVEKAFKSGRITGACSVGMRDETELLNYEMFWAAADMIFSSSIQEGFGYLYLNALHNRKPLTARRLDIMDSFIPLFPSENICLYDTVLVPLKRVQKERLLNLYKEKLEHLQVYIGSDKSHELFTQLSNQLEKDELGFSYFSLELQMEILEQIDQDREYRKICLKMNSKLVESMEELLKHEVPNRDDLIGESYGDQGYFKAFSEILDSYSQLGGEKESDKDVQKELMECFTTLPYIRLLY